jgi:N-acetylneuraminic acid mutarotase
LYIVGGVNDTGQPLTSIEQYDMQNGATVLPYNLKYGYNFPCVAAVVIDKLPVTVGYLANSFEGTELYVPGYASIADVSFDLPHLMNAATAVLNKRVYFMGGIGEGNVQNIVVLFDFVSNTSTTGVPLIQARACHSATVVNNSVIVCGGNNQSDNNWNSSTFATCEKFDAATNNWQFIAPMPIPLHNFAMTTLNHRVYVFGGTSSVDDNGQVSNAVFMYDGSSWRNMSAMPMKVEKHAVVSLDIDRALICGGKIQSDDCQLHLSNQCYIYTMSMDNWTIAALMARQRCQAGMFLDECN